MDGHIAYAQQLGTEWMRVEQWGTNATYDTMPTTVARLSAQNVRILPLINMYSMSWMTPAVKQAWIEAAGNISPASNVMSEPTLWR
jgi:hypothetical protein